MASVVCTGVVTADLVFRLPVPVDAPVKYRATDSALTAGGCALNAAAAVARLGGAAHLAGSVGADALGDLVCAEMAAEGVATGLVARVAGVPTARSAVLVGPGGERTIANHRDPRLFAAAPVLPAPFSFDAALADTRWPEGGAAVLAAARAAGRPAVLDAENPVREASGALRAASHVAFSELGLADWAGEGDPAAALERAARDLGIWVCVTRGPAPVLVHDGAALFEVPVFAVTAVDTLGAGDVWHGAFALFLAEGFAPLAAVRRANAVAALKSSAFGGRSALPDRDQLDRFLKEHA
ncbi:MAG TPA: PfkB family carbohydrate kinase [Amaricoccus sp.]|uniref:PfkB family carbohydrate kinase n=1 Tax=Amaricoccus sp. TaxID=1872485 RepID=UPI002C7290FA|nr:PfkB family carbohydrate kinase [Amaricoccus sp.]HMQ93181.1 PfkB family carbohydrate kinase [Amaricoccus sp.]HMR54085.1 PfkB family carbohydrate kinase [Amaricoccus sp.]HMR61530.1 PfkB family carbohydrate kinase [Amaricoccus sp.]HMU01080.1 PfkB family carbohydrate kinase [Amaricoccus sp.]